MPSVMDQSHSPSPALLARTPERVGSWKISSGRYSLCSAQIRIADLAANLGPVRFIGFCEISKRFCISVEAFPDARLLYLVTAAELDNRA